MVAKGGAACERVRHEPAGGRARSGTGMDQIGSESFGGATEEPGAAREGSGCKRPRLEGCLPNPRMTRRRMRRRREKQQFPLAVFLNITAHRLRAVQVFRKLSNFLSARAAPSEGARSDRRNGTPRAPLGIEEWQGVLPCCSNNSVNGLRTKVNGWAAGDDIELHRQVGVFEERSSGNLNVQGGWLKRGRAPVLGYSGNSGEFKATVRQRRYRPVFNCNVVSVLHARGWT